MCIILAACSQNNNWQAAQTTNNDSPNSNGQWYQPNVNTTWQWQLSGDINASYDVDVYDIDLFDTSEEMIHEIQASGKKVVCYFSGGSYEEWREDAGLFNEEVLGETLDGWPDERWLDIRSASVREIMSTRLNLAQQKGCDGVEPDNMDGYINDTGFDLSYEDQLAFNQFIAVEAHDQGLAVGLKNDLDQIPDLINYFDFAVNEQCHEYDECGALMAFIEADKPVFNAEYQNKYVKNENQRQKLCEDARDRNFQTLILPLDLDDSFRFDCH